MNLYQGMTVKYRGQECLVCTLDARGNALIEIVPSRHYVWVQVTELDNYERASK